MAGVDKCITSPCTVNDGLSLGVVIIPVECPAAEILGMFEAVCGLAGNCGGVNRPRFGSDRAVEDALMFGGAT